ncbi:MAG: BACON domain-containing protein [Alistipes sp.]
MRKFISGLLAIAAAAFTGCYESGTDADNTSREARISISPAAIGFDADGRTTDGLAFGTYIVTVNPYGKMYSDWHAELVGTDWATLDYHTASPDGAVEKALRITCSANTDYKRTGTLRVTLSKTGESVDFPITQVGLKPDATLTLSTESDIEMMALEPAEVTVTFETNMPASTVTAELEEGVEWLTCTLDREAGTVVLAASDNTSPTDMREATVTVSAGTEDTSLATRQIKVRQLANETYLFIYGSGIPHFAAFGDAAQMNKNDLVFGLDHYFRSGKVILSTSRTPDAYPRYALTADGKLAVLADAAAEAAAPELTFGIAGMNALRVTIALDDDNNVVAADSKAEFTRISTVNSMPESELAGYPTKEYVTRDGKTKTWMTTGLHWNGGAAMGTYKLGSGLVGGSKTGGYDEAEYSMRNPAYDTEENGGTLKELMMPDGVTTRASVYGRLYSSYETLTGDPAGALSAALLMPFRWEAPGRWSWMPWATASR